MWAVWNYTRMQRCGIGSGQYPADPIVTEYPDFQKALEAFLGGRGCEVKLVSPEGRTIRVKRGG